jgi:hypothetical protein
MTELMQPIHIATIGGHQLRFYRIPSNDGRPDMPWYCVDDLHQCLGLSRPQRKVMLSMMRKMGGFQTIATTEGVVTIGPHYTAQRHNRCNGSCQDGRKHGGYFRCLQ